MNPRYASSYKAFCVDGTSVGSIPDAVPRPHIGNLLARCSMPGSNIVITGPAGSGKSTVALQLALRAGEKIHYICARRPGTFSTVLDPGHAYGELFATTLTMLTKPVTPARQRSLASALETLTSIEFGETDVLVLDDLDLIQLQQLAPCLDLLGDCLPEIKVPLIIFIVRQYTDEARYLVAKRGTARVLPSTNILLSEHELSQIIRLNTFRTVSEEMIRGIWQQTGGWFAGMRFLLDANGSYSPALEEYVLNDLVMLQPQAMQSFYLALGAFPQISPEMVTWILEHLPDTPGSISGVFDTIPLTISDPSPFLDTTFSVPAAIAMCLNTIAKRYGHPKGVHATQQLGIDWFILHDDLHAARKLAVASGLTDHYLTSINTYCATLAMNEEWRSIRDLVEGVPTAELLHHNDFLFWLILSNRYDGLWPDIVVERALTYQQWKCDQNPLVRGRALLLESWDVWAAADDAKIHAVAVESYTTLPETALQERMFAAGTAEIGARIVGNTEAANCWSTISNKCRQAVPMGPVWWYTYVIFHRASQIAMSGDLELAQDIAQMGLENTISDIPVAKLPLLLLLTYISVERGDRTRAQRLLTQAQPRIDSDVSQKMFDLAQAHLHMVSGNFEDAFTLLGTPGIVPPRAPDLNIHRLRSLARLEMMENRIDLAMHTISQWSESETNWPRYFGEPSHDLLLAVLHAMRGEIPQALALTSAVMTEARSRSHLAYALSALAIEAECYQRIGDTRNRDAVLTQISEIDPKGHFVQSAAPFGRDVRLLKGVRVNQPTPTLLNPREALDQLTKREIELLEAAASGLKTREIADQLCLAESTVKNHLSSVYRKLGVRSRREALMVTYPLRRKTALVLSSEEP